jgi:anti-sigma B factor antagonist
MKIQTKKSGSDLDILELEGELDFHSSGDVRAALSGLTEKQAKKVLVDLAKVSYIDSSGLATFVELFQKLKRYGGKLVLFNLAPSVRSVFEIAKLDSIFHLAASEKEAISAAS